MGKRNPFWALSAGGLLVLGLLGCQSNNQSLTEAELAVEQRLNDYVQDMPVNRKFWYQRWFPRFFPTARKAGLVCYSGFHRNGESQSDDSTGAVFVVVVSEQDTVSRLCSRDSSRLKQEALSFARQLRPVLPSPKQYARIDVEYSTCLASGPLSCSTTCERTIRFSLRDTASWATSPLQTTVSAYRTRAILHWEDQE